MTVQGVQVQVERIYIGGLDPSRLSVKDVLKRLEASLGDKVEIRNLHEGSSFCQLDALSKETRTKEGTDGTTDGAALASADPALKAIVKLYNNVTWKGCKLKVEPARPHFLERLAKEHGERDERIARDDAIATQLMAVIGPKSHSVSTSALPRHLKIHKGHGKVSWSIDTKPCRVTEWTTFRKMTRKLLKTREKSAASGLHDYEFKAHCNRGVHLRFPNNDAENDGEDSKRSSADHANTKAKANDDQESTEESSIDSGSDTSDSATNTSDSNDSADDDDDDESDQETLPSKRKRPKTVSSSAYVWSDDDQDSDSDATADFIQTNMNPYNRPTNNTVDTSLDEFAAATMDDDDGEDVSFFDSVAPSAPSVVTAAESADLKRDVEANLNVLAALFPDMAPRQPRALDMDTVGDTTKTGPDGTSGTTKLQQQQKAAEPSSWTASGQMLRYDPTKESAKQFVISIEAQDKEQQGGVVEPPPTDKSTGDLEEEDSIGSASVSVDEETSEEVLPKPEDVYEEGKLEDVFREARKAQEAPTKVVQVAEEAKQESGGGFSFSFKVDDDAAKSKPKEESGAFSFSFGLPAASSENELPTETMPDAKYLAVEAFESVTEQMQVSSHVKRRRGLAFPEEDLDKYVNMFYSLNEGRQMVDDLDGFRRDGRVQEHWAKERLALTQDWKRKRKYAQSRSKKKFGK